MQRRRIALPRGPVEEPPEWWGRHFRARQAKCRMRILVILTAAEVEPHRGLTAYELKQRIPRFDGPEVDHAIQALARDCVITQDVRTVRHARGGPFPELYWRIAKEDETDGR